MVDHTSENGDTYDILTVTKTEHEPDLNKLFDNDDLLNIVEKTSVSWNLKINYFIISIIVIYAKKKQQQQKFKYDLINDIRAKSDKFKQDVENLILVKRKTYKDGDINTETNRDTVTSHDKLIKKKK